MLKLVRLTAPLAACEIASLVASPKVISKSAVSVIKGEASSAVRVLSPSAPVKTSEPKVARPLEAFRWAIPEIVASETDRVICSLLLVTRLLSWSLTSTVIALPSVIAFRAVAGEVMNKLVAVPCARVML